MSHLVSILCGCYSALLVLYPRALREAYGQEMTGVLREQLLEGSDILAVLRAFAEVVTIGVPARIKSEVPAVAPLAVCATSAIFYGFLFVLHDTGPLNAFMRRWLGVHCP